MRFDVLNLSLKTKTKQNEDFVEIQGLKEELTARFQQELERSTFSFPGQNRLIKNIPAV